MTNCYFVPRGLTGGKKLSLDGGRGLGYSGFKKEIGIHIISKQKQMYVGKGMKCAL